MRALRTAKRLMYLSFAGST